MPQHYPIIIPEINNKHSICDYLIQTALITSQKSYPTYIFYSSDPPKFTNRIIQVSPNLFNFSPIKIIPFNRFKISQNINIYLSFNLLYLYIFLHHSTRPFYWIFYPQVANLIKFSFRPRFLIHDIIDFFTSPNSKISSKLSSQKKYFLQKSNLVTSISTSFKKNYLKIFSSTKIHLVPQGFKLLPPSKNIHPQIKKLKKLTNKVAFIGVINNRLDFDLLFKLIKSTPKINYLFIGPVSFDINVSPKPITKLSQKLFSFKNVVHIDLIPKDQIAQFIEIIDIAIIPYDISDDFNRLCCPMKLFEYFAGAKPVISTPIEELKLFPNLVFTSNDPLIWQQLLNKLLSKPWPLSIQKQQKLLAKNNSWENKVKKVLKLISQFLLQST